MLGTALVGSVDPEVVISYVKPDTTIDYVDPSVGIFLDYDSKNKEFLGANGETVTLSESFSRTVPYIRAFTDSITLISDPTIGQIHKSYPDHSVSIGDEITVAAQYNLLFTDSISSSDATTWTIGKNFTESISTGDTPSIGQIHHENPTDGVTVSDTPSIGQIYHVSPTDGVSASDATTVLHDGMLNTNMLNTRLLSVGSLVVDADDVVITHTEG